VFWLKKLIGWLAAPLPVGIILATVGAVLLWRTRRRGLGRTLLALGVLIPLIASNRGLSESLISQLEDQYPTYASVADVRYIAVLGGGHADNPDLPWTTQLHEASRARLVEGVRLQRQNPDAVLICLGPQGRRTHSHAEVLAGAAEELGVDPRKIVTRSAVRDTHDEILSIKKLAGEQSVLLVTSAWHMPRAMGLAQKAGLKVTAAPTDYLSPMPRVKLTDWFEFSVEGLLQTSRAVRENLGLLWAQLRGQR
jgi:uncharacterized SAM-binding protein YcdF (DUF218 family)